MDYPAVSDFKCSCQNKPADAIVKLISQELKCFREDMKEEVRKLGHRLEALLDLTVHEICSDSENMTTSQDILYTETDPTDNSGKTSEISQDVLCISQTDDYEKAIILSNESSNEVIDITDFFDDLEVPQLNASPTPSSTCRPEPELTEMAPTEVALSPLDISQENFTESSHTPTSPTEVQSVTSDTEISETNLTNSTANQKPGCSVNADQDFEQNADVVSSLCNEDQLLTATAASDEEKSESFSDFEDDLQNPLSSKDMNDFLSSVSCTDKQKPTVDTSEALCKAAKVVSYKIGEVVDHSTGNKVFECPFCYRRSKALRDMQRHVVIHTGERRFKCMFCSKGFKRASHMRNHMRTHTGEKPFQCDQCPKAFCGSSALLRHKILHENEEKREQPIINKETRSSLLGSRERPHVCTICDRKFRQKSHMQMHMQATHYKEKTFQCAVCNKCFARKEHLVRHIRSHTGEKPYQCTLCSKSFGDHSSLRKHKISVH